MRACSVCRAGCVQCVLLAVHVHMRGAHVVEGLEADAQQSVGVRRPEHEVSHPPRPGLARHRGAPAARRREQRLRRRVCPVAARPYCGLRPQRARGRAERVDGARQALPRCERIIVAPATGRITQAAGPRRRRIARRCVHEPPRAAGRSALGARGERGEAAAVRGVVVPVGAAVERDAHAVAADGRCGCNAAHLAVAHQRRGQRQVAHRRQLACARRRAAAREQAARLARAAVQHVAEHPHAE